MSDLPSTKELVESYAKLQFQKEEMEAAEKVIKEALLEHLDKMKLDSQLVSNWSISRARRVSFKTDIEIARSLGAIKEAVDDTKLRQLDKSGVEIPGKQVTVYLLIRDMSQKDEQIK